MNSLSDVQTLRCLQCMKEIKCSPVDPIQMVVHIQRDHPEIFAVAKEKMKNLETLVNAEFYPKDGNETDISETKMNKAAVQYLVKNKRCACNKSSSVSEPLASGRQNPSSQPSSRSCPGDKENQASRKQSFRASITHWEPAEGNIFCPSCGFSQRPLIKTSSEMTATGGVATCLFACWPLCCLPFLVSREYLYCSNCRAFLGIYDREKNCVKPSREFVGAKETDSARSV